MSKPPKTIKIYHITHIKNLPSIVKVGALWSDAKRLEQGCSCKIIGMNNIKERRLNINEVKCCPGIKVGDCVPFYFCPRSIMLYILHMGNHAELNYREGQEPIIHLQSDLKATIAWANKNKITWAFSGGNAGASYVDYYSKEKDLKELNWEAIHSTDFSQREIKDGKQAEFLMCDSFPWELIEKIGVFNASVQREIEKTLKNEDNPPLVSIEPTWYY